MGENTAHTAVNTKDKLDDFGASLYLETKDDTIGHVSFATLLKGESSRKQVNFHTFPAPAGNGGGCSYLKGVESLEQIWPCQVNDDHQWWSPDANIMKEDVCNVPVWVKFHDILITAFTKDGLSVIATKLSTPLMLDSYMTHMCLESQGRSSYARAMIELWVDVELKDTLVMDILKFEGEGYTRSTIHVEHEWKPPRCINEENSKLAKKWAISNVVSSAHQTTSEALGTPTITPLAKKINDLER
ncbi:exostosin-like protein [Tanacetum coccineum]